MAGSLATFLAIAASALPAFGQDLDLSPRWQPEWSRFDTIDVGISAASAAAALTLRFAMPAPAQGWKEGLLFDDAVRDALRANDPFVRSTLSDFSDGLEIAFLLYPVVIDAGLVAGYGYGDAELATDMALMSVEAFLVSSVLVSATKSLVGRVRPDASPCPEGGYACRSDTTRRSFISGHSASAFTSAGIMCAHHAHLALYGGGWADRGACIGAIGLAAVTGTLRVVSDRHYATDVVAGAVVGFATGYLVPTLLHYSGLNLFSDLGVVPAAPAEGRGLALAGWF